MAEELVEETLLKTLLIYIKKRIGETEKLCEIPVFISLSLLACALITSYTFRFV